MRWFFVLAALVAAVLVWITLRSGGERSSAVRLDEVLAEARANEARSEELLPVAPPLAVEPAEGAPSAARSETVDETPRVRGVVLVDDGEPLGEEITLEVDAYRSSASPAETLTVPVGSDGVFEFLAPLGTSYVMLEVGAERLHTPTQVRAEPGEEVVVVAQRRVAVPELPHDLVIAGIVLDQHGQPFAEATIFSTEPGSHSWSSSGDNRAGADGRFELTGLARQRWRVGAHSDESFGSVHQDVDGTRGDVFDVVLTLERGGCIEGTVRWPDGTAVEEFEGKASIGFMSRSSTFRGGRFELCGLMLGKEWLVVITAREGEVTGTGSVAAVRPGGPPLEIVLETGSTFGVLVRVRDAQGAPVQDFDVWAWETTRDGQRRNVGGSAEAVLDGLTAGDWRFQVLAPGFEDEVSNVTLTPGCGPLEFELSPDGKIRGRVVDAQGRAVQGADVFLEWGGDSRQNDTDEQGLFEVGAPSGEVRVRARLAGSGISDPVTVHVTSAEVTEGLVLELGPAARLAGRVFDAGGQPASGVHVSESLGFTNTTTDTTGAFVLEGLAPGSTRVFASDIGDGQAEASVELFRGQTSTIELRFLARDPVRVRGRATLAGQPYTGSLGFHGQAAWGHAECDRDGRFTVELDRSGAWTCWRSDGANPAGLHALDLLIPDVEEHELTLDLDTMRRLESFDELR